MTRGSDIAPSHGEKARSVLVRRETRKMVCSVDLLLSTDIAKQKKREFLLYSPAKVCVWSVDASREASPPDEQH